MKRRLINCLLGASCVVAPLALLPAASAQAQSVSRPTGQLELSLGRGQLVTLPAAMKDVFVADEKVADVQVKSNRQLYIFGRAEGETTIYASNAAGQTIWSTQVRVGQNIENIGQMLKAALPDANITVTTIGQIAVINGTVASPEDSAQAFHLVAGLLNPGLKIDGDTPLRIGVINRLRTATPLQVMLKVRIAEVSRSLTRAIGANLTTYSSGTSGMIFGMSQGANQGTITNPTGSTVVNNSLVSTPTVFNLPSNLANSTAISLAGKAFGLSLLGSLDLGEQVGLVTTLAEPNLTALSGETADFLAGGEFPIPISEGLGAVSIEYKKFGVSLSYTPTVLADGRISLRVRPEVSELSSQGAVTLNGFTIPALTVRRAETTVELGSGQSFMIAGLLNNTANHTIAKLPGAGDLPVLGALFKSTSFVKGETELVIVVTPYLVKPVNDGDIKLPTDGYQNPNDIQRVLGNMLTDGKSGAARPGATAAQPLAKPEASPEAADAHKVSAADSPDAGANPAVPAPAAGKPSRTADAGDAATPGFNLN